MLLFILIVIGVLYVSSQTNLSGLGGDNLGSDATPNVLTAAQIAQYAASAGWTGTDLITAVAVALAESGGDANAQGDFGDPNAGVYNAFGLWQVNTGENPQFANDNLLDPQTNANDAYAIWQQIGWGGWSTYSSGKYAAFIPTATAAAV